MGVFTLEVLSPLVFKVFVFEILSKSAYLAPKLS